MKYTILFLITFCCYLGFNSFSFAQLSDTDQNALNKTQDFLKNKSERNTFIKSAPDAQKHMNQMEALGLSESQKNEMFNISSDIFGDLIKKQNGDAEGLKRLLQQAEQNPEAFYNSLSPESREKIKKMGGQIQGQKSLKDLQ